MNPALISRNPISRVGATPEQIRRAAARAGLALKPKGRWGGLQLPEQTVRAMFDDYQRLRSTDRVGRLYGRTGAAIQAIFRRRGLPRFRGVTHPSIEHGGLVYHLAGDKYPRFRVTIAGRVLFLHKVIWQEKNGQIPAGHQVAFRNGDPRDVRLDNLVCLPRREIARMVRERTLSRRREEAA